MLLGRVLLEPRMSSSSFARSSHLIMMRATFLFPSHSFHSSFLTGWSSGWLVPLLASLCCTYQIDNFLSWLVMSASMVCSLPHLFCVYLSQLTLKFIVLFDLFTLMRTTLSCTCPLKSGDLSRLATKDSRDSMSGWVSQNFLNLNKAETEILTVGPES